MISFKEDMELFRQEIEKGHIQRAYSGLMDYFASLKSHFKRSFPEDEVASSTYFGTMDMTCFSILTPLLKARKLKIAIVFTYETFSFEVWLSGVNRKAQAVYWQMIKDAGWNQYTLSPNPKKEDYIARSILAADPDFGDLDALTDRIRAGTLVFIQNVEAFLSINILTNSR